VVRRSYVAGNIVRYTDGKVYRATHDNPGYDPVISTRYRKPVSCGPTNPDLIGVCPLILAVGRAPSVDGDVVDLDPTSTGNS
jgi:hypothetical protein